MQDVSEEKDLFPSVEEIEGIEESMLDQEEAQFEKEDAEDDVVEGIGEVGRVNRAKRRARRRAKRKAARRRAVRKSFRAGQNAITLKTGMTKNLTSKAHFELRRHQLPKDVQEGLKTARLQVVDAAIYTIKSIENKSDIDLMESSDDKKTGRTNLNRAQLDNGKFFLLTGIVLEYAHGEDENDTDPSNFPFGQYAYPPQIMNGTFEMTLGTKVIVPELSCGIFDDSDTTKRKFYYGLDNPKWLKPAMDITPRLNMPKAVVGDGVYAPAVKVTLIGAMIEKA